MAVVVAHLLLAQLALVLALVFALASRVSRWRLWWLLAPAAAGLAWTLAVGPDQALAGFAAGPASILRQLGSGHFAARIDSLAPFSRLGDWLPRQFPVALPLAAAEAALIGWLDWLHTDEWAVPPPRPGVIAAVRRAVTASAVRAGTVVTREGCALGVVPATGAVAELRWAELSRGALVVGAAAQEVTLAGLQVVHAALRRRKPVIVLDPGESAIRGALAAACTATGVPPPAAGAPADTGTALRVAGRTDASTANASTANAGTGGASAGDASAGDAGTGDAGTGDASTANMGTANMGTGEADGAGASRLWGRGRPPEPGPADRPVIDLGQVVRERSAALIAADTAELAARACTGLTSLAADLCRIGVEGDALVWVPRGEQVPAPALAALLRDGAAAGLCVLIGTASPAAAAELGGMVGALLIHRVADRDLAAGLAAQTGARLVPASLAAALAGGNPDAGGYPSAPVPPGAPAAAADAPAADLVPCPAVPARTLLTLGEAEFVLAVSVPRRRLIVPGRTVPARLPQANGPAGEPGTALRARRRGVTGETA